MIVRQPTRAGVRDAAAKIAQILPPSPLFVREVAGVPIAFKAESLQPMGAFKLRGAWHRLTALDSEARKRGVVAFSSGNHAQGVAWAAKRLGLPAVIVMPADAPRVKRLAVVVQSLPDGKEKAGEAWARVARRYVNQKRDFLVKKEIAQPGALDLTTVCGGEDAIEGVLLLNPTLVAKGDGFEVDVTGALQRCGDGREAWKGQAA